MRARSQHRQTGQQERQAACTPRFRAAANERRRRHAICVRPSQDALLPGWPQCALLPSQEAVVDHDHFQLMPGNRLCCQSIEAALDGAAAIVHGDNDRTAWEGCTRMFRLHQGSPATRSPQSPAGTLTHLPTVGPRHIRPPQIRDESSRPQASRRPASASPSWSEPEYAAACASSSAEAPMRRNGIGDLR